ICATGVKKSANIRPSDRTTNPACSKARINACAGGAYRLGANGDAAPFVPLGPVRVVSSTSPVRVTTRGRSSTATAAPRRRAGEALPQKGQNFERSLSSFPQYGQNLM